MQNNNELLSEVASYYTEKLTTHGQTPQGVDWNGEQSQTLRFEQLCKIITNTNASFSLNDLGCGYGALLDFLYEKHPEISYCGIDVSNEMIRSANSRYLSHQNTRFLCSSQADTTADYSIASGIFNVRLGRTDAEWFNYVQTTLNQLEQTSRLGFSFNCLTSYSDEDKKRDYLYYADPCQLFDLCKRRYSRQVALLHDYGLYEFTILVRKS
jgi:SAM-dependent methyltransferase